MSPDTKPRERIGCVPGHKRGINTRELGPIDLARGLLKTKGPRAPPYFDASLYLITGTTIL